MPNLRSLYICYLSLDDPLVQTQVVAYLEGLVRRGHVIHLLTFDAAMDDHRRELLARKMESKGLVWHSRRYHKRPSLPATVFDVLAGAISAMRLVRRHRLEAIHARNHVPAACALLAKPFTRSRLIFDIRGLMAEEYVDAGRWKRGGAPYRLTNWVQRVAIERADAVVVLTHAVRRHLFGTPSAHPSTHVIPCCADLERLERQSDSQREVRNQLGVGDRPVLAYVGKFTGRYMDSEMVDFFAQARRRVPDLFFLIVTQADRGLIEAELRRSSVSTADYLITQTEPEDLGRYLSVASAAVYFYRHSFSEIAASPTKVGEYLGAGLPVVSSSQVGDIDGILEDNRVGVLVNDFSPAVYDAATEQIMNLVAEPATAERCKEVARRHFSLEDVGLPRYDRVYRTVADAR
jgi:glycosyltransferase involved in cell wall biosynthesis